MRGTDISQFKQTYRTRNEGEFPDRLTITLQKENDVKYGENPHQQAAIYRVYEINGRNTEIISRLTNLQSVRSDEHGKGGLSMINMMDIAKAMDVLKYFTHPAAVIMKHNIVSGFAKQTIREPMDELFRRARDTDRRSNFGGTFVLNRYLDMATAKAMYELKGENFFVDVLAAPGYDEGVLPFVQERSRTIRIGQFDKIDAIPKFVGDDTRGLYSIKEMPTGRIGIQDLYLTRIKSAEDFILDPMVVDKEGNRHVVKKDPDRQELDDLLTSWWLNCAGARSNGVVSVKGGVLSSLGAGQVERVGAVEQAIVKGMQKAMDREGISYDPLMGIKGYEQLKNNPFEGSVVSSDGFFPFADSIKLLKRVGVTAVVQPFGSIKDAEVIDAANEAGIAMPATLERCFGHF